MSDTSPLVIEQFSFDDPVVVALVDELQGEFVVRYGGPDETVVEPGDFEAPRGAFYVGFDDGLPVAMGGWRFRPDVRRLGASVAAEIKRMYARAVLAHLERTAASASADVMVLETGLEQPEAIALYASSGYVLVENFGYYQDSPLARCFAKRL